MSSRRKSVSGSAVRVVKRKLSPPSSPAAISRLAESRDESSTQSIDISSFTSPLKSTQRRLSALGGPARIKTPSKKTAEQEQEATATVKFQVQDKENNENVKSIFRFCADKNDGNASDDCSRDSLDCATNSRRSSSSVGDRRSSTSSHDSGSSLGSDTSDRPWCSKDFSIGKAIGKGKFGNVYLAKVKKDRSAVALKVLFKAPMRAANCVHSLRREVEIQCRLKHPNITQLLGYFHDSKNVYLVLEYVQQGELFKFVDKQGGRVDEPTCQGFMRDISAALTYLHAHRVAHRDLKPENVLFDIVDGEMSLRIADFGCAVVLTPTTAGESAGLGGGECVCEKQRTVCGTPEYLAPEVLLEAGHGLQVDLWAAGVFIFELLAGRTPFVDKDHRDSIESTYANIKQHTGSLFPLADLSANALFSAEVRGVLDKLLSAAPERRASAQELHSSSWLAAPTPLALTNHSNPDVNSIR